MINEAIIPKLCDEHLLALWEQTHQAKKPPTEFADCPLEFQYRRYLIYQEAVKRGYLLNECAPSPFDITDEPIRQALLEAKRYVPFDFTDELITFLKQAKCKCMKQAIS